MYPQDFVEDPWTEFLSGTLVLNDFDGSKLYDLCSDGSGVWHDVLGMDGTTFKWWTQSAGLGGGPAITLVMSFNDGPRPFDTPNSLFYENFYPSIDPTKFNMALRNLQIPSQKNILGLAGRPVFTDSPDCE